MSNPLQGFWLVGTLMTRGTCNISAEQLYFIQVEPKQRLYPSISYQTSDKVPKTPRSLRPEKVSPQENTVI